MKLNQRASQLCHAVTQRASDLRAEVHCVAGASLIDLGVKARGGLEAGLALAEICLSGLGRVQLVPGDAGVWQGPAVAVSTDHPVAACLASQYAGWQVAIGKYFAMASGPMRAVAAKEELVKQLALAEAADVAVGVLETSKLPPEEVVKHLAHACGLPSVALTLVAARTASQAGTAQVVARSVETALHKLHELKFDVSRIESGWGLAPLPPPAADDLAGIGRTNDAILYGGRVTLWVRGDDESLQEIGPKIPSCSSSDHGEPFAEIFRRAGHDFYKIDPLLFSPAAITLCNVDSGRSFTFGRVMPEIIERSFRG
ncbi:MAG: methenyltetrahydromethanopterin cyclohydrolase [Planctomycetia bacterium 21-64-5]|nr:MAG: methenyltetrahydromethanopterin cyclohydrolase [Planctomycetia bacterium 21-64-5]HQU45868.1 methenyltetrahydromethanopterin cyclohydrolase [Pirellulales bacterium]